mmetsp:Transcript_8709/g.20739  ORF Transcript_8709/g.20739 Transcript_8709/m.20739 type:complete len:161 (+) Transcript_8709:214-696(+)
MVMSLMFELRQPCSTEESSQTFVDLRRDGTQVRLVENPESFTQKTLERSQVTAETCLEEHFRFLEDGHGAVETTFSSVGSQRKTRLHGMSFAMEEGPEPLLKPAHWITYHNDHLQPRHMCQRQANPVTVMETRMTQSAQAVQAFVRQPLEVKGFHLLSVR